MVRLNRGDRINCRLKESKVVNPFDSDFDEEKTFEIISVDEGGYYLFVPNYFNIKESYTIDRYDIQDMNIEPKFIGEECIYVLEKLIYKIHTIMDGIACSKCKNFHEYASANQPDGTLICWYCRTYPK